MMHSWVSSANAVTGHTITHQRLDVVRIALKGAAELGNTVHRDVSPSNIILCTDPATGSSNPRKGYLCDWDLSRMAVQSEDLTSQDEKSLSTLWDDYEVSVCTLQKLSWYAADYCCRQHGNSNLSTLSSLPNLQRKNASKGTQSSMIWSHCSMLFCGVLLSTSSTQLKRKRLAGDACKTCSMNPIHHKAEKRAAMGKMRTKRRGTVLEALNGRALSMSG